MSNPPSLSLRDSVLAGAFVVGAFILMVLFRTHFAYHWDGAQFALAIDHYDIRIGQPHPPGSFLYVMLGRLMNLFVGDPHASLVWLSMIAGAVLAGLGFLLGS